MKKIGWIALVGVIALGTIASAAQAGGVKNGNFKAGFKNWTTVDAGGDLYRLYDKNYKLTPPSDCGEAPYYDFLPPVRSGKSPFSDQCPNPGTVAIHQSFKLSKKANKLQLWYFVDNFAGDFYNFGGSWDSNENQYFSIDLIKKNAKYNTSKKADIIKTVYAPKEGGSPPFRESRSNAAWLARGASASGLANPVAWTKASVKIPKKYRGKKVQLREIVSVFTSPMLVGLDDVKVIKKKKK